MDCVFLCPLDDSGWNASLSAHAAATIFHTANWAAVLGAAYRYPSSYAVIRDRSCALALLPVMEVNSPVTGRRGVSLPFSDECSPLLSPGISLEPLLPSVLAFGDRRNWDYLELRSNAENIPGAVKAAGYKLHLLPLEPSDDLQFDRLKASQQRNIRKAVREGVEIHRLETRDAVDEYYMLHCLTRKRQGVPPQPRQFFHAIHQFLIAPGNGFVLLARFNGRWIAGGVFLHFGRNALYKFGASDPAFQHLRANSLLMWEAIRHYRALGMRQFSFGRTDPDHTGLLRFKRSWGAEEVPLSYYRIGIRKPVRVNPNRFQGTGIASRIMRHMPVPVLRLVGELAYRHIG